MGEKALKRKQTALTVDFKVTKLPRPSRGAVAQLVERPSKVPIWCNSTDVGSNYERDMSSLSLSLSLITQRYKVSKGIQPVPTVITK